jgi:uncharacterized protein (DUF58 family)
LLAVLLLSGFQSALNFQALKLDVSLPSRCFTKETFELSARLLNQKRLLPTVSMHVTPPAKSTLVFPHLYFAVINPHTHQTQSAEASFSRRGRYALNGVQLASRYPFGFLAKERTYSMTAECICYPEILPQEKVVASVSDILGSTARFERGFGNDLYGIREYLPSDNGRHVHWKASAKTGSLKTREYAEEESQRIVLALDRFGDTEDSERFEQLVSFAASLAFYLIKDGAEVALISDEWMSGFGTSEATLDSILTYLATVEMSASAHPPTADGSGVMPLTLRQGRHGQQPQQGRA